MKVFLKSLIVVFSISLVAVISVFGFHIKAKDVASAYIMTNRKVPVYAVDTSENVVGISFDAAWGADKTRDIMKVCKEYNVNATFFLVGFWIDKYPEMVKEIYNNGFEIGLHSNTHPDMTKLSKAEMREELEINISMIENLTNFRPKLFRPPFGYYNNALIEVCEDLDLVCIEWSVDSLDWKGISASELSGRVLNSAESGSIVLFHNNSDNILAGLRMVLEGFKQKNLLADNIGDVIFTEDYEIDNQGIQRKIGRKYERRIEK